MEVLHFIYPSVDGYLGCFHFLVILNNAVINIHVQVLFFNIYLLIYLFGHVGS